MSDFHALWRVSDVMRYLQVSRSWEYHRVETGLLPCLRIGELVRFDPKSIREFAHTTGTMQAHIVPINRARNH